MVGYVKGKSTIHIARVYAGRRRNFVGQQFWARGHWSQRLAGTKSRCVATFENKRKKQISCHQTT